MRECFFQIFDCGEAPRVVGRGGGAAETLAEDAVSCARGCGVEGLGEEGGLELCPPRGVVLVVGEERRRRWGRYLHQVEEAGFGDRHYWWRG